MSKELMKDALGWGFLLWSIGYVLGIILFMVVPSSLIGWVIMPIGIVVTLWALLKKIKSKNFQYYGTMAITWTLMAIVLDYFFIVNILKPTDGYYKLDVYLYYIVTFVLPLIVGWRRNIHSVT